MSNPKHCRYCGCSTTNQSGICNTCTDKLLLIRKLRAIVFQIKRAAEREKKRNGQKANHSDTQAIQDSACRM